MIDALMHYLERAVAFERLAADETDNGLKADLERQARAGNLLLYEQKEWVYPHLANLRNRRIPEAPRGKYVPSRYQKGRSSTPYDTEARSRQLVGGTRMDVNLVSVRWARLQLGQTKR